MLFERYEETVQCCLESSKILYSSVWKAGKERQFNVVWKVQYCLEGRNRQNIIVWKTERNRETEQPVRKIERDSTVLSGW